MPDPRQNDDSKPLGQRIRDLINPALEDDRRVPQQAAMVDREFGFIADKLEEALSSDFRHFFNHVAQQKPAAQHPTIIDALSVGGRKGDGTFEAIKRLQLSISTTFTTFTAEDVKDMPGYIRLHEVARKLDIAVKVVGLTAEESRGSPYPAPAMVIIDATKSYEEGAADSGGLYPNLPEKTETPKGPPKPKQGKSHNL